MNRIYKSVVVTLTPERFIYRSIVWMFALLGAYDLFSGGALWLIK